MAILVPPACREEVLGDLHERCDSRSQYIKEALLTIPLIIFSRLRRTADLQILLIQAFALYLSFLAAARLRDGALPREQWGLLRLAIPAVLAVLGLVIDDIYATPAQRSALSFARGPLLGAVLTMGSQGIFWIGYPDLAIPRWVVVYGCGMSLLLSSAVRMLLPPVPNQLLKQAGVSRVDPHTLNRASRSNSAFMAVAIAGLVMFLAVLWVTVKKG